MLTQVSSFIQVSWKNIARVTTSFIRLLFDLHFLNEIRCTVATILSCKIGLIVQNAMQYQATQCNTSGSAAARLLVIAMTMQARKHLGEKTSVKMQMLNNSLQM